jgi:hypothetical protein
VKPAGLIVENTVEQFSKDGGAYEFTSYAPITYTVIEKPIILPSPVEGLNDGKGECNECF